jgi:hypothetical protein
LRASSMTRWAAALKVEASSTHCYQAVASRQAISGHGAPIPWRQHRHHLHLVADHLPA